MIYKQIWPFLDRSVLKSEKPRDWSLRLVT